MNEFNLSYDVDLKKYNTYGIGGVAKYLFKPKNVEELMEGLKYLKKENISWLVLGGGSNVILPDSNYDGAIIKLDDLNKVMIRGDEVYVEAGIYLNRLIKQLLDLDYINLKELYGIPGTLGGAIICNAGCNQKEIFDELISITIIEDGLKKEINKEQIKYSYRYTEFKGNNKIIIIGATLKLQKGNAKLAWEEIKNNLKTRKEKQPLEYKNAGSVFKNPQMASAGKLIEECQLKGYKINDAMVSKKHANFIINIKNATSHDIISLIELIKKHVLAEKNIVLEMEQIIIKW